MSTAPVHHGNDDGLGETLCNAGRAGARIEFVGPGVPHAGDQSVPTRIERVAEVLDPILVPLGFAPGQAGAHQGRGQVIFCSTDGDCIDLAIDVEAAPDWQIVDVRYWGFPSERWHLDFVAGADLAHQLDHLARSLPAALADEP